MKQRFVYLLSSLAYVLLFILSPLSSVLSSSLGTQKAYADAANWGNPQYALWYPNDSSSIGKLKNAEAGGSISSGDANGILNQTKLIFEGSAGLPAQTLSLHPGESDKQDMPIYSKDYYCSPGDNYKLSWNQPSGDAPYVRLTLGVAVLKDRWKDAGALVNNASYGGFQGMLGNGDIGSVSFPQNSKYGPATVSIPGAGGDNDIRSGFDVGTAGSGPGVDAGYYGEPGASEHPFTDYGITGGAQAIFDKCRPHPSGRFIPNKVLNYWKLSSSDQKKWDQIVKSAGLGNSVSDAAGSSNSGNGDASGSPALSCNAGLNPLNWLICGVIKGLVGIVGDLDNLINGLLAVGSSNNSSSPSSIFGNCSTCNAYYDAWKSFRNISLGLIVVAGLIIVISQALGFEILDAYTIRKLLPRLIIATILMTLSWPIMQFFVELTNALGYGIRHLIYAPFSGLTDTIKLGGGGGVAVDLLGAGAISAMGIFGLLSFVATAGLAVFVAFLVLIIRQIVIVILIILAPIAIVAYILPNTQNAYKLWWDSFAKALLMFPIIAGLIAAGRVFSAVASQNVGPINALIAFAAYFAPYFLIPVTFRYAGGALRGIGGFVNDRHKGGFDRLKQYRKGQVDQNLTKMKSGDRWQGNNFAAKAFNRTTGGLGVGYKGRFGLGSRGQGALDLQRRVSAAERMQDPKMKQLAFDDKAIAVMALSGGTVAGARRAARQLGLNDADAKKAVGTAQSVGFTDSNTIAALDLMAQNKSRALTGNLAGQAGLDLVRESASRVAKGDGQLTENVMGSFAFHSRNAGRLDLGGESDVPDQGPMQGWQRSSVQQHAQAFGESTGYYARNAANILRNRDADGNVRTYSADDKRAATIALSEMHAALPAFSGENQTHINAAMDAIGIDHNSDLSVERQLANVANGRLANDDTVSGRGNLVGPVTSGQLHPVTGAPIMTRGDTGVPTPNQQVITANEINGLARKYGQNIPDGARGGLPPGTPGAGTTTPGTTGP